MVQPGGSRYKGDCTSPPFSTKESYMKRKHVSGQKYARKFNHAQKRTKAINSPPVALRGGFRL